MSLLDGTLIISLFFHRIPGICDCRDMLGQSLVLVFTIVKAESSMPHQGRSIFKSEHEQSLLLPYSLPHGEPYLISTSSVLHSCSDRSPSHVELLLIATPSECCFPISNHFTSLAFAAHLSRLLASLPSSMSTGSATPSDKHHRTVFRARYQSHKSPSTFVLAWKPSGAVQRHWC